MAVREIVSYTPPAKAPDVLRATTTEVEPSDAAVQQLVTDLIDTLFESELAIGLAAPQVGVSLSVAVINLKKKERDATIVLINPKVISETGKKDRKIETCMSVLDVRGESERRSKIKVSYVDRAGKAAEIDATGFLARVLAHEIDHLSGVLYVDRMPPDATLKRADVFA
jgi:peptide deformylase